MKVKYLVILLIVTALASMLCAEQEQHFPKGKFDVFPQPQYHQSRLDSKSEGHSRSVVWSNGCESSSGWSLAPNWEIGIPTLGPNFVPQGTSCLATGLGTLYANNANIIAKSPSIALPFASYVELNFSEWFELESNWDFGYVEVLSLNGTYTLDARTGITGFDFRNTSLNLTRFQGQSISLQFHLVSDGSVPAAGWYVDDLSITALEPLALDLRITGVNHSHHPSVYLTAAVNSPQGMVTDLTTANFSATENGISQTNLFTVISPDDTEQQSATDIVFVLDVTGSMSDEINAVRNNMTSFMQQLQNENIDYRIGFVVFGDIVYVYNQYQFYSLFNEIMGIINNITLGEHGIGSGGDFPENQVEAMAEGALFQWRPGASRVMIMLTDATSHETDEVTQWSIGNLLAERLLPNSIIVFPIFNTNDPNQMAQYLPIAEQTNPDGSYFSILSNFNTIINQIGNFITSLYTVHYISDVPFDDPITRMVKLQVQRENQSSEARVFYIPGISPMIQRSDALIQLDQTAVANGQAINFEVRLTDRLAPGIQEKLVYWRQIGQTNFSSLPLNLAQGDVYQAALSGNLVQGLGIEYYIQASDGQTTASMPSSTPQEQPFCIAINPATHAQFINLDQAYIVGVSLSTTLQCVAPANTAITMYYRPIGSLVYRSGLLTNTSGNIFASTITADLGNLGVECFFTSAQPNGVTSFYGTYDQPLSLRTQTLPTPPSSPEINAVRVFPNPLNLDAADFANISFEIKEDQQVKIEIFNVKGQKVRSLGPLQMTKGTQQFTWDGTDAQKRKVSSGIYLYRLTADKRVLAGKILVSK